MKKNNQKGFSLIELILVVTIIGIIAAIAIPSLTKAVAAAENGAAISSLKAIYLAESTLFSQKNRYSRLDEINAFQNGVLGTITPTNTLIRGKYEYEMIPNNPTDDELKNSFKIKASRSIDAAQLPFVLEMDQNGQVVQITP